MFPSLNLPRHSQNGQQKAIMIENLIHPLTQRLNTHDRTQSCDVGKAVLRRVWTQLSVPYQEVKVFCLITLQVWDWFSESPYTQSPSFRCLVPKPWAT
jgi:hypothetical protein